jgi:hypothetical protein
MSGLPDSQVTELPGGNNLLHFSDYRQTGYLAIPAYFFGYNQIFSWLHFELQSTFKYL